jgi:hypothetical protein
MITKQSMALLDRFAICEGHDLVVMSKRSRMLGELRKAGKALVNPLPIPSWAARGLFLFFLIGLFGLLGLLGPAREFAAIAFYGSILYVIVLARLLYGIFRRNLKKQDFALWVGAYFVFIIIAACLH